MGWTWTSCSRSPVLAVSVLALLTAREHIAAAEGELITYLPFSTVAPQDIAYDEADGSYWVTAFLDNQIVHLSPGLADEIESFESPVPYPTGICYNSLDSTLFVAGLISTKIIEVDKGGQPKRMLEPDLDPVVNPNSAPAPRGMAFDRTGDGGRGSIYLVESMGTVIYEVALDGTVIRSFVHPDDPDGYPGKGATAPASDVDLIYEGGKLAGFYVNGGRGRVSSIRRLDLTGRYTGITIPIEDSGGTVSGFLRQDFERGPGEKVDAYVCVVESNARFAILEGGEPPFHEILDFLCAASGRDVHLTWTARQNYDAIDVVRGCEVLATLAGNATEWRSSLATEGVYELTVVARQGGRAASPPPCTSVVGPGEVLRHAEIGGGFPIDMASDGGDLILVSDASEQRVMIYDRAFTPVGSWEVSEAFLAPDEYMTGIAYSERDGRVFLFNASTSNVAILDEVGILVSTFEASLPNLEEDPAAEPDRGFVIGMDFDPRGDGGRGSLWVFESARDQVYEIDLEGDVIHDFPHPYLAIDPPPPGTPYGAYASGIAVTGAGQILLSGGSMRDPGQIHIFHADPASGLAVPGTAIPTSGLRALASGGTFTFDATDGAGSNLLVLIMAGRLTKLVEVRGFPFAVPPPTFLTARQPFRDDSAFLRFTNNAPYDAIEVYRDCARVATIPGDAASHLETGVPPGVHQYAVRGVSRGVASDFARATVRVGRGAVLERAFVWPARSPQQLTRDPTDGSFYLATNWYGDERKIYHYDSQLRFLEARESTLEPPWQIAALAVRAPAGGGPREIHSIAWTLPVPIGEADAQSFFLYRETTSGEPLGKVPIDPPRPTNGFVTFPTGLAWEPERDTFFFLERNSKTLVEMTPAGEILRTFPHPAPPFQNFVFNLGLAVDPVRRKLLVTGSERFDHKITTVREMTYDGALTGFEIPLGELPGVVTGIALAGDDLVAVAAGSLSELFRLKAHAGSPGRFLRGDADGNAVLNLTDAIFTLDYLFRAGRAPPCEDAADADDGGTINLTDPVTVLLHLFASGPALPAPYPQAGDDPTADGLSCSPG